MLKSIGHPRIYLDELALHVQALEHGGDLGPPAMHHHHVHTQLFVGWLVVVMREERA